MELALPTLYVFIFSSTVDSDLLFGDYTVGPMSCFWFLVNFL